VTLQDFRFIPTNPSFKAGTKITVVNESTHTVHTFTVEGTDINVELQGGETGTVRLNLKRGTYRLYCVPHAALLGMETDLKITG
jgi:plastocyanin